MRFKKKPVVIEARQINSNDYDDMCDIIKWVNDNGGVAVAIDTEPYVMYIETLEGEMAAAPGDWIIKGVAGEFYPCKPNIFEVTYEEIPEPTYKCRKCQATLNNNDLDRLLKKHDNFIPLNAFYHSWCEPKEEDETNIS